MSRNGRFIAELFDGVNVGHIKVIPSVDGSQLGISFLPPEGEPISIIVQKGLVENMVTDIAEGLHKCHERSKTLERQQPRLVS